MEIHIDYAVKKTCWNLFDSYGEICVGYGCCSPDMKTRYESRISCLERWLDEQEHFDNWIEGLEALQEKNRRENIKRIKRKLRYYKRKTWK